MKIDVTDKGIFKVVGERELETCTRSGWGLVFILDQQDVIGIDEPLSLEESEAQRSSRYGGGLDNYGVYLPPGVRRRHVVVEKKRYVLLQDEQSAVAAAEKRAEWAEAASREATEKVALVGTELGDARVREAKQAEDLAQSKRREQQHLDNYEAARRAKARMEADLGKLREALGAQKMKEILST